MNTPTYSLNEIENLVELLEEFELSILFQLVEEEKNRYTNEDLEAVYFRMMSRLEDLKVSRLVKQSRY